MNRGEFNQSSQTLSLVLPAFNEEAGIAEAITEADEALKKITTNYEILVIDDGSEDETAEVVVETARKRPRVRLLRHEVNQGYGAALRTGFEAAQFDKVAFTDADCQFDLTDLAPLSAMADQFPIAAGYRLDRKDPWKRRFFSWGYNRLIRLLLGIQVRDCDCALKVFRKHSLKNLLPETQGFFVNAEMLTKARQMEYQVGEVGVSHRPRRKGTSKVSLWDIPRTLRTLLPFWWTQVAFPRPAEPAEGTTSTASSLGFLSRPGFLFLLLLWMASALFFTCLHSPLLEPEEARYAEIPRQMLEKGGLAVPTFRGEPYLQKPPLLYWLVIASYKLWGIHDWSARMIPCTAGFLGVLITFLWGKRTLGAGAGVVGGFILCLSGRFVYMSRMLSMDSLLCLWVSIALFTAHLAVRHSRLRRGWWILSAATCGLGVLTKGPVAIALVLPPIVVFQWLDRRVCRPRFLAWTVYLAGAIGLAAPWYAVAAAKNSSGIVDFFWTHNLLRYVAPLDHTGPFWFYLPIVILGMFPWSLLLPGGIAFLLSKRKDVLRERSKDLGFFLLAFGWSLVFFSLAGCKRPGYILPAMPPLAIFLGFYLHGILSQAWGMAESRLGRVAVWMSSLRDSGPSIPTLANHGLLVTGVVGAVASLMGGIINFQRTMLLAACFLLTLVLVRRMATPRRRELSWAVSGGLTFALLWTGLQFILPGYSHKFSLKEQVRETGRLLTGTPLPVICYPHAWDSVSFYLGRNDVRTYSPELFSRMVIDLYATEKSLVFVKSEKYLPDLLRRLPASLEFIQQGEQGLVTAGIIRRRAEADFTELAEANSPPDTVHDVK